MRGGKAAVRGLRRSMSIVCVLILLAGACTGSGRQKHTSPTASSSLARMGGTLHVGLFQWNGQSYEDPATQSPGYPGLGQCCLLRTLMSYNGTPTAQGGAVVRPDLASAAPSVSGDGLIWTFHLKRGLFYAPPLQRTPIVAQDVIRALDRSLSPTPKQYVEFLGTMLGLGSQY